MNTERKKELMEEYRNRRPEMGLVSYCCISTGECFISAVPDTKAAFNSTSFKLSTGSHPNKHLLALWNQYGENNFQLTVPCVLKYSEEKTSYSLELARLLDTYLAEHKNCVRIWR